MGSLMESTTFQLANAIRALSMDGVQQANSGHPGAPMGLADVATVLFSKFLNFDPTAPHWPDRDRFILSAGHASMLLYSLLHLTGYEDMTIEQLKNFRQYGSITAGHPEYGHASGIETTTGPLGQGISNAVGFAMAERHLNAKFGDLMNHKTYVICGDGCLMEGISQEAIGLAGHLKLANLIVIWDDNNITIDGRVSIADSTDQVKRFEASGWRVLRCDGHDFASIEAALTAAQSSDRPVMIAAKTIIGKGSPNKKDSYQAHGSPLGPDEIKLARAELDWPHAAFEIPSDILNAWRAVGARGADTRKAWEQRLAASAHKAELTRLFKGELPASYSTVIADYKKALAKNPPHIATRNSSQNALDVINPAIPETIGGSADLTGSNNTKSKDLKVFSAADYAGRYVHWGIREHGMAAEVIREIDQMGECDLYDVLSHHTYRARALKRLERGQNYVDVNSSWFGSMEPRAATVLKGFGHQFAQGGTDALETAALWDVPEIREAGGLAALQKLGRPVDVVREAKGRLFGG
jgi:transketolase